MRKTYTLNVAGVTRELPLCPVNEKLDIAAFVMFSDVELTVACAEALLKKVPEFDIIVTAEAKGIPLAYEMSRQSGKRYIRPGKAPSFTWRSLLWWRMFPLRPRPCRSSSSTVRIWIPWMENASSSWMM